MTDQLTPHPAPMNSYENSWSHNSNCTNESINKPYDYKKDNFEEKENFMDEKHKVPETKYEPKDTMEERINKIGQETFVGPSGLKEDVAKHLEEKKLESENRP